MIRDGGLLHEPLLSRVRIMTDMLMSAHERSAQNSRQARLVEREQRLKDLPCADGIIDICGDGKCLKKTLKEGTNLALPGDRVRVKYTGWVSSSFEPDGTPFDSGALTFQLGSMQVISGWDLGIATMREGERAMLKLAPDHAYGIAGSPPVIPPNAVLLFDVEVLSVEEVSLHAFTKPQLIAGLIALAIILYYSLFFRPAPDDEPDL